MRLALRGGNIVEWFALRAGLVPVPAAEAWAGMALSGVLVAATELGLTRRLAAGPATAAGLARELGLDPTGTRLLLECLRSGRHVARRAGRYRLRRASRRWLDPDSPLSVARFVAATGDYWSWWASLPEVARTGQPVGHHAASAGDAYWRRYVTGQFELARLSAGEVAARLRVPAGAASLLDIGGAHGWYAVELCRRHPGLRATVLDLPGSAQIGRELIARAGLAQRVRHRDGDARTADLGGGYDLVLCFNLVHHLTPAEIVSLFGRIRAALSTGGSLAVLDAFSGAQRRGSAANVLGLFTYLSSGAPTYTAAQLREWLAQTGFAPPRRAGMRRVPGLVLYQSAIMPR